MILAHQLASMLLLFGVDAQMFYYRLASVPFNSDEPVHDRYKKYHVPYAPSPEDSEKNIAIVPEAATEIFSLFKKIQRVIWWMSVDGYLDHFLKMLGGVLENPLGAPLPKMFYLGKDDDATHFVQSEYARQFLKLNGVPDYKVCMVEDYVSQAFLSRAAQIDLSRKENFVAYNPLKGFEITQRLIQLAPDIDWRPIRNMTPEQVQELLAASKVYIDFGKHPGKDRIPREAAVSGCVVITGRRGSAANDIDINIPDEFKFDGSAKLSDIVAKIREVFENFSATHEKQADYRARILDDKNRFVREVAAAFELKNPPRGGTALAQGFGDGTEILLAKLQAAGVKPAFIVDDLMSTAELAKMSGGLITREQNRNYMSEDDNPIEIITRDDAKFLYQEGRIENFALLAPTADELAAVKNFYEPNADDLIIY